MSGKVIGIIVLVVVLIIIAFLAGLSFTVISSTSESFSNPFTKQQKTKAYKKYTSCMSDCKKKCISGLDLKYAKEKALWNYVYSHPNQVAQYEGNHETPIRFT
jgi:hypothetical protein